MTTTCFHVTTAKGTVYGVAATTKRDALAMVSERLTVDCSSDSPATAKRIGTWQATYGTVLAY